MSLSLRAKFLVLSAFVQLLLVALLIGNSLRVMDDAVRKNAERVAHEYAVTLNLSLSPYAMSGRLNELSDYWAEMLSDPKDSFVRYIVVLDQHEQAVSTVGVRPAVLPEALRSPETGTRNGVRTWRKDDMLHARAPMLLKDNQVGSLNFGLSTSELAQARDEVLLQSSVISLAGLSMGMLLFYAFTQGIGKRLRTLTAQARQMFKSAFGQPLPDTTGDEIEVYARSLNTMGAALRERVAQLEASERRLSESEARFKTLFDMAPLPLTVTDRAGRIIGANQALMRNFGYAEHQLVGHRSSDFTFWSPPGERERVWQMFMRDGVVRGEVAGIVLEGGIPGKVAIWSSSLTLDGVDAVIWALLDLTAEVKAKQQLEELNASLESRVRERSADLQHALETLQQTQHDLIAAEKMASLGSLVAGIAHELNTPIGNSLLAATALSDKVNEFEAMLSGATLRRSALSSYNEEVKLASGLISGSLQKAANLIASFKQIAVDQTNDQRREFMLLGVVTDTVATYLPRLRRANCDTDFDVPPELALDSYPGSLYQVFTNLINNALAHAFEHRASGAITVRAAELPDGMVEIVFSDNGVGMPEEVRRHVFDPFFTTKMGKGGTGLGMNIVYNIVTGVLGGRVSIASRPEHGTTVRITMPRSSPQRDGSRPGY
ncbi:ATP-binding protein [Pseudoduganella namucuonensis]|uniref:histidine kinase n=1 Tax=Pseudoduganella namucuonensis TaxID=1035707 RepID=A0A1I7EZQ7_9BURK|nr:ATP-binding protein [Pseudoduganella namucuonensis]SFU29406.1 PAS domain S-box-containing protein [Pseudoduganella namucuonensis]